MSTEDPFDVLENSILAAHPGAELMFCNPPGGKGLLNGVIATRVLDPEPHWLLVSQGFSELWEKVGDDPDRSGFGYELTCRVPAADASLSFGWVLDWMKGLREYVDDETTFLDSGHTMQIVAARTPDDLSCLLLVDDVELTPTRSRNGTTSFLQIVAVNAAERAVARAWDAPGLATLMRERDPLLLCRPGRSSHLADAQFAADLERAMEESAGTFGMRALIPIRWVVTGGLVTAKRLDIRIGRECIPELVAMTHQLRHGHDMVLTGGPADRDSIVVFRPGPARWDIETRGTTRGAVVSLPRETVLELRRQLEPLMRDARPLNIDVQGVRGLRLVLE